MEENPSVVLLRVVVVLAGLFFVTNAAPAQERELDKLLTLDVDASAVAFCPNGDVAVANRGKKSVSIYEFPSGELKYTFGDSILEVSAMAVSPDGKLLATAGCTTTRPGDFELRLWSLESRQLLYSPNSKDHFSADGKLLATGTATTSGHGTAMVFDLEADQWLKSRANRFSGVLAVAFGDNGAELMVGHVSRIGRQTNGEGNYAETFVFQVGASALAFSSNCELAAMVVDGKLVIHDSYTGDLIVATEAPTRTVVFFHEGETLATIGENGQVMVWRLN